MGLYRMMCRGHVLPCWRKKSTWIWTLLILGAVTYFFYSRSRQHKALTQVFMNNDALKQNKHLDAGGFWEAHGGEEIERHHGKIKFISRNKHKPEEAEEPKVYDEEEEEDMNVYNGIDNGMEDERQSDEELEEEEQKEDMKDKQDRLFEKVKERHRSEDGTRREGYKWKEGLDEEEEEDMNVYNRYDNRRQEERQHDEELEEEEQKEEDMKDEQNRLFEKVKERHRSEDGTRRGGYKWKEGLDEEEEEDMKVYNRYDNRRQEERQHDEELEEEEQKEEDMKDEQNRLFEKVKERYRSEDGTRRGGYKWKEGLDEEEEEDMKVDNRYNNGRQEERQHDEELEEEEQKEENMKDEQNRLFEKVKERHRSEEGARGEGYKWKERLEEEKGTRQVEHEREEGMNEGKARVDEHGRYEGDRMEEQDRNFETADGKQQSEEESSLEAGKEGKIMQKGTTRVEEDGRGELVKEGTSRMQKERRERLEEERTEMEEDGRGERVEKERARMEEVERRERVKEERARMEEDGRGERVEEERAGVNKDGRGGKFKEERARMEEVGRGERGEEERARMEEDGRGERVEEERASVNKDGRGVRADKERVRMEEDGRGKIVEEERARMEEVGREGRVEEDRAKLEEDGRGGKVEEERAEMDKDGRGDKVEEERAGMKEDGRGERVEKDRAGMEEDGRGDGVEEERAGIEEGGRGDGVEKGTPRVEEHGMEERAGGKSDNVMVERTDEAKANKTEGEKILVTHPIKSEAFRRKDSEQKDVVKDEVVKPRAGVVVNGVPDMETLESWDHDRLETAFHNYVLVQQTECSVIVRLGKKEHGGWNICHADTYRPTQPCLMYSFGFNTDYTFEDDVARRYGCETHYFDPQITYLNGKRRSSGVFMHSYALSSDNGRTPNGWEVRTLVAIKEELQHTQPIDILKVDIEENEWRALPEMVKSGVMGKVTQFLLEVHVLAQARTRPTKNEYIKYLTLLRDLYQDGFRIATSRADGSTQTSLGGTKKSQNYEILFVRQKL